MSVISLNGAQSTMKYRSNKFSLQLLNLREYWTKPNLALLYLTEPNEISPRLTSEISQNKFSGRHLVDAVTEFADTVLQLAERQDELALGKADIVRAVEQVTFLFIKFYSVNPLM